MPSAKLTFNLTMADWRRLILQCNCLFFLLVRHSSSQTEVFHYDVI